MNVAIDIPDDVGQVLAARVGGVSRAVLEAVAIEAYRSGAITPGPCLDSSSDEPKRVEHHTFRSNMRRADK